MATVTTLGPSHFFFGSGLASGAYTTLSFYDGRFNPDNNTHPATFIATAYGGPNASIVDGSMVPGKYGVWVKDLSTVATVSAAAPGEQTIDYALYVTLANTGALPIEQVTIYISIISQ